MSAPKAPPFSGVIFDLDGTLTKPEAIDFARMRRRIGMPEPGSILHWIEANAKGHDEAEAMRAVVWEEEALALERMELGEGIEALVETLLETLAETLGSAGPGLRTGICTRNSADAIQAFDERLRGAGFPSCETLFHVAVARDHHSERLGRPLLNKPSPEPAHEIVHAWGLGESHPLHEGSELDPPRYADLLFVGDAEDDLLAGRRAGTAAGWMDHGLAPTPQAATHSFGCLAACAAALVGLAFNG